MNITVNSEQKAFSGTFVSELMQTLNLLEINGIALAVNEKVISRAEWKKYELKENDKILLIKATQGG